MQIDQFIKTLASGGPAMPPGGAAALVTLTREQEAWQAVLVAISHFDTAYSAHFQPADIDFPDWPSLAENPSISCLYNWIVITGALIWLYTDCLERHAGNPTQGQICVDTNHALLLPLLITGCLAQS